MTDRRSVAEANRHLYLVAGYPTSGKSSCLWKSAQERHPLFGTDNISVVPEFEAIRDISETMNTQAKLKAGFWCTLGDLAYLNEAPRLPERLILHLDLLLVYLLFRAPAKPVPTKTEMEAAFARFFAQPALRRFEKYTVTNLRVPLEEIQRRWRYRYRAGPRPNESRIMAEKHRLTDGAVAAAGLCRCPRDLGTVFGVACQQRQMAGLFEVQVRVPPDQG